MKLMVLDGNSIANRGFYGVRPLTAPDGTPTNAIFGFMQILFGLLDKEKPDGLCITFDVHAPTFRKMKYEPYKAQRKPMPEELRVQMPILREIMERMNVPHYEIEGYEADDLMGTISRIANESGWECALVTGDKDSFQLIGNGTTVLHVKTKETKLYDEAAFSEEYGFGPKGIIELKALMGDTSDNIPGVPGVGEKTAMDLVQRFGTIEKIYSGLDSIDIKDSVRKKLDAGREMAELSHELVVINRNVPLDFSPEMAIRKAPDNDALYELFNALGLKKFIEKLSLTAPQAKVAGEKELTIQKLEEITVTDDAQLDEMLSLARSGAAVSVSDDFLTACVATGGKLYTFCADSPKANEAMREILSERIPKKGHNIKDLMHRAMDAGIETGGWTGDTALAAYLLDPAAKDYDIVSLAGESGGAGESDEQLNLFDEAYSDDALKLRRRTQAIFSMAPVLEAQVENEGMGKLYREIELPLCRVLADMEHEGFYLDGNALKVFGAELNGQIKELEEEIYALAGCSFNINSPKQLGEVLFEKLKIPAPKKTKTGYSTNVDVLDKLKDRYPICALVLQYRELTKLTGTYVEGLLKLREKDGRIRTTFQMTVTATGRLSSTDPNLQNIPIRKALGGEVRKMFSAAPGKVLVDADYSQIELRLLACISGDKAMQEAFINGEDIHRVTAAQVLGIEPGEVTAQQRSQAKAVNFGIVYGISAFSLSQDINVSVGDAQRYIDSYLQRYPGVREYMERVIKEGEEQGCVRTLYGRVRPMPELKSANHNIRSFGERVCRNAPIQGTAADIMKKAMIAVYERLKKELPEAKLIMQVHDELIVECPEGDKELASKILCEEMSGVAQLSVPLTAEAGCGFTWYDAK